MNHNRLRLCVFMIAGSLVAGCSQQQPATTTAPPAAASTPSTSSSRPPAAPPKPLTPEEIKQREADQAALKASNAAYSKMVIDMAKQAGVVPTTWGKGKAPKPAAGSASGSSKSSTQ
ncbi:MAG: hypothetical protein ACLQVD_16985 [Capsulimonadaceae bacterium]